MTLTLSHWALVASLGAPFGELSWEVEKGEEYICNGLNQSKEKTSLTRSSFLLEFEDGLADGGLLFERDVAAFRRGHFWESLEDFSIPP